jgi:hypothetical protein
MAGVAASSCETTRVADKSITEQRVAIDPASIKTEKVYG